MVIIRHILYFFCNIVLDKNPRAVTIGAFRLGLFSVPAPLINLDSGRPAGFLFALTAGAFAANC